MKILAALFLAAVALRAEVPPIEPDLGTVFISFTALKAGGPVAIRYESHVRFDEPVFQQASPKIFGPTVRVSILTSLDGVSWFEVEAFCCHEGAECQYAAAAGSRSFFKLMFDPIW